MTIFPRRHRAPMPAHVRTPVPSAPGARTLAPSPVAEAVRAARAPHVIANSAWRVGVLPATGASLAFGQIQDAGSWLDLLRPTPIESYLSVEDCASFVMLPWSNRVGRALLDFRGERYRLRVNADDGTAIHGTAREFPWEVQAFTPTCLELSFDSRHFSGVNYPWPFSATVNYRVSGTRFTITTLVCNQHDEPIPVGFGHHPYFARALAGPGDQARLEIPYAEYYELERALPTGPPVPVADRVDFRSLRPLGAAFVDDCFTGRIPGAPVRIVYPESGRTVTMGACDVFTHAVVYIPPDKPFFAVEPVTNANDAFSLHERGTPDSGLVVLGPGEGVRGSIWLDVVP